MTEGNECIRKGNKRRVSEIAKDKLDVQYKWIGKEEWWKGEKVRLKRYTNAEKRRDER